MQITAISKRVFKIKKNDELIPLLKKLRKSAEKQKGFISRATFTNVNDSTENIVINEWKSEEHWQKWMKKNKVKEIQDKIDSLIGENTVFDVYFPEPF